MKNKIMQIKKLQFIYDNDGLSHITCLLNNKKFFDIDYFDFICFLCDNDDNLKKYFDKFETLEGLIDDLRSLEFDFKSSCERYINKQFTKEELEEFTYSEY